MMWLGVAIGAIASPIFIVVVLWLLRDVTPFILFPPSDWDD